MAESPAREGSIPWRASRLPLHVRRPHRRGSLYVDKTEYLYRLVGANKGQFFMARPRRFGKSLTVSTLEAIFRGRRELFGGLWIDRADYGWEEYPVIHLDFARMLVESVETLSVSLRTDLRRVANEYQVQVADGAPVQMFSDLIIALHDRFAQGVVLLIDEYDRPVSEHVESDGEAEEFRRFMEGFYQMIKGREPYLRFTFMTGVTKFAKLSVFSKLNNLDDITMDPAYACMMGYTQRELSPDEIAAIDEALDNLLAEMTACYAATWFSRAACLWGRRTRTPCSLR